MPVTQVQAAPRFRPTPSKRREMNRKAKLNKRFRRKPVEITQQPVKKRNAFVGRVSFVWLSGPKKDQKHSVMITLQGPARLYIKGLDLEVRPRDGLPYFWGKSEEREEEDKAKEAEKEEPPAKKASERERRFKDILIEKYDQLLEDHGPHEAGMKMAKAFVKAHNKMTTKKAKRALGKVYGQVLRTNKAGHSSFARTLKTKVDKSPPDSSTSASVWSTVRAILHAAVTLSPGLVDAAQMLLAEVPAPVDLPDLPKTEVKKKKTRKKKAAKPVPEPVDLPDLPKGDEDPDEYRKRSGKCPDGYHFDEEKQSCVPTGAAPADDKPSQPTSGPETEKPTPDTKTPPETPADEAADTEDGSDKKQSLTWDPARLELVDPDSGRRYTVGDDGEPEETRDSLAEHGEPDDDKDSKKTIPERKVRFTLPDAPGDDASSDDKAKFEEASKKTWEAWRKAHNAWKKDEPKFPDAPGDDATNDEWDSYDSTYEKASRKWDNWSEGEPMNPKKATEEARKPAATKKSSRRRRRR